MESLVKSKECGMKGSERSRGDSWMPLSPFFSICTKDSTPLLPDTQLIKWASLVWIVSSSGSSKIISLRRQESATKVHLRLTAAANVVNNCRLF
jgi:hypothetical protein